MIWKEFWFDKEIDDNYKPPMFKSKKNNLPKNLKTPNVLKIYLGSIKSETMDPQNRNKVKSNISESEMEALKDLVRLQREQHIVIKQCDKGAGIMILDFKDYIIACLEHLQNK